MDPLVGGGLGFFDRFFRRGVQPPEGALPQSNPAAALPPVPAPSITTATSRFDTLAHYLFALRLATSTADLNRVLDNLRDNRLDMIALPEKNRRDCEDLLTAGLAGDVESQLHFEALRYTEFSTLPEWAKGGVKLQLREVLRGDLRCENGICFLGASFADFAAGWATNPEDFGRRLVVGEAPTVEVARMILERALSFDYEYVNRLPPGELAELPPALANEQQRGAQSHALEIAVDNPGGHLLRSHLGEIIEYAFRAQFARDVARHFNFPDHPEVDQAVLRVLPSDPWTLLETSAGGNLLLLAEAIARGVAIDRYAVEKFPKKSREAVEIRLRDLSARAEASKGSPSHLNTAAPAPEPPLPLLVQREHFLQQLNIALVAAGHSLDSFDEDAKRRLFALVRKGVHAEAEVLTRATETGSGVETLNQLRELRAARRRAASGGLPALELAADELFQPRVAPAAPLAEIQYLAGSKADFLLSLPERIRSRADVRLERIRRRDWGDATIISKYQGEGTMFELRFPGRDGYRIYVGQLGGSLYVLGSGPKDTQRRDIDLAIGKFTARTGKH